MLIRNANIVGAAILFGLVVAAAIIWGYSLRSLPHRRASVEVRQVQDPSWDVEVRQMPSDASSDEDKPIVVAEH